ncbi:MAG: ABC transporter ATP-binding protein [Acidimicrobiales bacterium]
MPKKPELAPEVDRDMLVEVRDVATHFSVRGSFVDRLLGREAGLVRAVDGVSFDLHRGEVLGLVGESGSGKTTLGRTILRLLDPSRGAVRFDGQDITNLSERDLRPLRRRMQIVFQDPHASLNPAMSILTAVGHPLVVHGITRDPGEVRERVAAVLERVGLVPVEQFMGKYPGQLSGGQKQRAALARAIILGPDLLVADEPVSMLDMSVRAKILELMLRLKDELDLTYLYITHDLATAKFFCDRIAIMYLGKIVEIGPAKAIYADPKHPYTRSLLRAVPQPDPTRTVPRDVPRGEVPDAVSPPLGCSFHPRCPNAFEVCGWESRDLRELLERRWTRVREEDFEAERGLVGDLEALDRPWLEGRLPAGAGHSGVELSEWLDNVREQDPDDPFWAGVRGMDGDLGGVSVAFHEALDPELVAAEDVEVACHLYDERALGAAERTRGVGRQHGAPRLPLGKPTTPASPAGHRASNLGRRSATQET